MILIVISEFETVYITVFCVFVVVVLAEGVFIIIVPSFFHTGTKITYTVSYTHK